jgi:hypothetical protein
MKIQVFKNAVDDFNTVMGRLIEPFLYGLLCIPVGYMMRVIWMTWIVENLMAEGYYDDPSKRAREETRKKVRDPDYANRYKHDILSIVKHTQAISDENMLNLSCRNDTNLPDHESRLNILRRFGPHDAYWMISDSIKTFGINTKRAQSELTATTMIESKFKGQVPMDERLLCLYEFKQKKLNLA